MKARSRGMRCLGSPVLAACGTELCCNALREDYSRRNGCRIPGALQLNLKCQVCLGVLDEMECGESHGSLDSS